MNYDANPMLLKQSIIIEIQKMFGAALDLSDVQVPVL